MILTGLTSSRQAFNGSTVMVKKCHENCIPLILQSNDSIYRSNSSETVIAKLTRSNKLLG